MFERIKAQEDLVNTLGAKARADLARTEKLRNLSVDHFVDSDKREKFRREYAALEVSLEHVELTSLNALGNPSAKLVLCRTRSADRQVVVAANEPSVTVSVQSDNKGLSFVVGERAPLQVRALDGAASLQNFIHGRDSLLFKECEPVTSISGEKLGYVAEIQVNLCQGARLDISRVGDFRTAIHPSGGTIVLGARPAKVERQARIRIDSDVASELVTISIPAGELLAQGSMMANTFSLNLDLQAAVEIELRRPSSDGPGVDVNVEVRGSQGNEQIPLVRDGRMVDHSIEDFLRKVHQVK